jgi:hypothetical protein
LLLYVWMKHPGHTYGGFVPAISERGVTTCKNDCILYRGPEYKELEKCPICSLDWFYHRKDIGDDEKYNKNRRKSGPKKVFWYFPIIPCLKHWFANKESELLRWHKEKHKQDVGIVEHPADAIVAKHWLTKSWIYHWSEEY